MKYFLSDIFYTEIKKETASLQSNKDKKALIYKNLKNNALHNKLAQCITQYTIQRITKYTRPTHHKIYSPNALQILRSIVLKNCKTMSFAMN